MQGSSAQMRSNNSLGLNMRALKQLLVVTLVATFFGCMPSTSVNPPAGWTKVDTGKFVFYVPSDIKTVPVRGIDSFVGQYKGNTISLSFDYGFYSSRLEDAEGGSGYTAHWERIGGKKARIASFYFPNTGNPFDYAIGVHFPEAAGKDVRLTVFATCKSTNEYETARMIFRTIKFKGQ